MGDPITLLVSSIALSYLASEMQKSHMESRLDKLQQQTNIGREIKANTRGTSEPLKVIYGKARIGGNNVYTSVGGSDNTDLYYIHTLCEGEIEGIMESEGVPYIWFDGERIDAFEDYYEYQEFSGTSSQTYSSLIYDVNNDFTDRMHYTAYVAWHLTFNKDLYRGIPNIQYLIKGRKLFDFRTSTTAWSDNPVLALYDYMTNSRYGVGLSASDLEENLTLWEEAADYCESKGFTINMAVNVGESNIWQVITNILQLFRGTLGYWDSRYYLKFRDLNEESSVMTIEDEHILQDSTGKASITISDPGNYDIPKGVRVSYLNTDENLYVQDSFVVGEEDDTLQELNLLGCASREMAGKLAVSHLERMQVARTISGRFRDDCLQLEPNDIITFNSTAMAIADQTMRVVQASYNSTGFIDLVLQYEDEDIYNDVYDIVAESIYDTTLPNPKDPALIENSTITEDTYTQNGRTFSKLEIGFDIPANSWFDYIEVWISTNGDVTANYKQEFSSSDDFTLDPAQMGTTYWIILRTVNLWGVKQTLGNATKLTHTVVGISNTPPPSLPYLRCVAGDGTVSLRSEKLDDPDIEVYEFRMGSSWSQAIFLSAKRSPHEEVGMVRPGTHDFWADTKGTNGLYGLYPREDDITVSLPKGWSAYTNFSDDFTTSTSGQVFTNVEHTTYGGDDYLKCSHTVVSGVTTLSGTYISEEFDTGVASATYFGYVDTDFVTTGTDTTWSGILVNPASTTWADINADTNTWQDLFEVTEAAQVTMRIWYSPTSGGPWDYLENAQILAGVMTGRYFRVEINIIDPAPNITAMVKEYTLNLYN